MEGSYEASVWLSFVLRLLVSHVLDRSLLSLYHEEDAKVSHFPKVSQPSSLHYMTLLTSQGAMNY